MSNFNMVAYLTIENGTLRRITHKSLLMALIIQRLRYTKEGVIQVLITPLLWARVIYEA